MNAVQKVKEICRSRKIPIYRLEKDLGFANGYIGQLKKGTFPNDRLVQIANYLNVATEYLTGEEEQKENPGIPKDTEVDPIRAELLNLIEGATEEQCQDYLDMLRIVLNRREKR
jgi:transcriptional regulator with XRE-family HTH domain